MRRWLNQVVVVAAVEEGPKVAVKAEAVEVVVGPVQRAGPLVVVELMPFQDVND